MDNLSLIRIMQLSSSTLPVGGFTYSQGLEWAVECQWVVTEDDLRDWLADLIYSSLKLLEIPLLVRMVNACQQEDRQSLAHWAEISLAHRETSELRQEEINRGRAMASLLVEMEIPFAASWRPVLATSQTAGFALAFSQWQVPVHHAAQGFAWAWLENSVISGIKLIPLGQMAGQRILRDLAPQLARAVHIGMLVADDEIGSSAPALAYASARHETQYTRLFRS